MITVFWTRCMGNSYGFNAQKYMYVFHDLYRNVAAIVIDVINISICYDSIRCVFRIISLSCSIQFTKYLESFLLQIGIFKHFCSWQFIYSS
jgi:hypothetical protein